ncbi:MAG: hypothetical protein UT00_C0030G0001, partial [Parcubacteria group bacterium GW2011_GWA1_38_7]
MDLPISIKNLHEDLKSKKYSLSELTDTYLRRIDTYDKNLNSFLTVTSDLAYLCGVFAGDGSISIRLKKHDYEVKCVGNPLDEKEYYN